MSFHTTLMFYRPRRPPIITGDSLAAFVEGFARTHLSKGKPSLGFRLKFGAAIDQDEKPTIWDEPLSKLIFESREIDWDIVEQCKSLSEAALKLGRHPGTIYRAWLDLGDAIPDLRELLFRPSGPENDRWLGLESWSMQIEPIESCGQGSESIFVVGWIGVNLSGYGYLYPWTFNDLFRRVNQHPRIPELMELCRKTWPVDPDYLDDRTQDLRRQMGELWPYPDLDRRWDWYWGLASSV
jgi:hypothetical protein